jgi:hypothetical protein
MSREDVVRQFEGRCPPELVEEIARATVRDLRETLERFKLAPPWQADWDQTLLSIALTGLRLASTAAAGMTASRVYEVRGHLSLEIAAARRLRPIPSPPKMIPSPPKKNPPPPKRAPRMRRAGNVLPFARPKK